MLVYCRFIRLYIGLLIVFISTLLVVFCNNEGESEKVYSFFLFYREETSYLDETWGMEPME